MKVGFLGMGVMGLPMAKNLVKKAGCEILGFDVVEKQREAFAAAGGTAEQADAAQRYADALGLAFQIRDDMLDVIGDEATFGKPIGSDKAEKKTTFVDLLGLAACEREVVRLTDEAISALSPFGGEADFLAALSRSMETRNK